MSDTLFIAFLGNPGREYAATRHNVGWMVADRLAERLGREAGALGLAPALPPSWNDKFEGRISSFNLRSRKIHLFKPGTFMNLSGQAVRKALDFYKLAPGDELLVVHDELELAYGQIAFRAGGGAGGHNGLRSLDTHCGGPGYRRCRIGIGRPVHGTVADFVLARFSADEETVLPLVLDRAVESLLVVMQGKSAPAGKIQAFQPV